MLGTLLLSAASTASAPKRRFHSARCGLHVPDTGEVWLSVDTRRRSREVGFAVLCAGSSWREVVQPLGVHTERCSGNEDTDQHEQPETWHLHTPFVKVVAFYNSREECW